MNDTTLKLISKLIQKTKQHSIKWRHAHSRALVKPTKSKEFEVYLQNTLLFDTENSYYADYNRGQFFLISDGVSHDVTLLVQSRHSSYSMAYASTVNEADTNIISELKRLYNIVDSIDYDVSAFVDNFLAQD